MSDKWMKIYYKSPRFIQTLGINAFELKEWRLRKGKKFNDWLKLLIESEHWNKKSLAEYQNKYLKNIIRYAYQNVPFYHELYKKNNIDISKVETIDSLKKLPIVTKEDIFQHWNSFVSAKKEKFILHHTSGTTGKPLNIRVSKELKILEKANAFRRDIWAGYDKSWIARFVGDTPIKNSDDRLFYRKSYLMRRAIFPTYIISVKTFPSIFDSFKKLNIGFLQCYPSAGYLLAKFLEKTDKYYPLKAVLYSSEPMYDFQKKLIEERFQTKVFGYYSQAEEVVTALECENGHYHLTMVDGILEILNNKGEITNTEKGFTIVTSLHNYAMPLIRYALNDYTGYVDEDCSCGRTGNVIYPIETKVRDFIITPSGKLISPPLLAFPIRAAQNVIESQYIQKTIDTIVVRVVKSESYSYLNEQVLLNELKHLLGNDMIIKIEYVDQIYLTNSYKKRFIINEIGKDYFEKIFEQL